MSRVRFIIFSSPRSGSTALRETLHGHEGVTCCGEIFGKNRILSLPRHLLGKRGAELIGERDRDPAAFAGRVLSAGKDRVIGFKLLPAQLLLLENAPLLRMILEDPSIRVIFLWRRDLVRRYLSEIRFQEAAKLGDTGSISVINVDPEDVRANCRQFHDLRHAMRAILEREYFAEIFFEDLIDSPDTPFREISELLELQEPLLRLIPENTDQYDKDRVRIDNEEAILKLCRYNA